ncbi:MAG: ABC transporter substrate-binding protein [Microbacterium gubbeenense]|uniref:ABC transporter substrate-binding protein n=1 Tax=Microbacterium gubbeenense TaxID=159896 RepID=UPI003F9B172D
MAMSIDRRGFLGLAGIAGASLFLAGCVGQAAPAPSAPGASLGPAAADATGNISYWNHFTGEDERRGFEAVTKGFAEAYPGLKLKEESIPNADFMTKFTTAAQAGSLPDSVMVHANRVQDMVGMNGLVDLSSAMDSWSGASDIEEKLLTPFRRDGALYAIPCTMFVDWFYYRADWLEELGYSEPPKTWQELREVAKAMTSGDRYGVALRGGAGGGEPVIKMIRGYNGPLTDADGAPTLDLEATKTALDEYSALYLVDKSAPPSAPADGYNQIFQSFLNGQTGMLLHHNGSLKSVTDVLKTGEQVLTAPMPTTPVDTTGWLQPMGNGIASPDNASSALSWVEYWGSSDPQVELFSATGYFPSATSGQQSPTIAEDPIMSAANEQVKVGVTPEYFNGMTAWQDNSVLVQFQSLLVGETTLDEAAQAIVDDFNKNF